MSLEMLLQLVMGFGVLPGLFVWLLLHVLKEHKADKEESRHREEKLMAHLEKTNESHERIAKAMESLKYEFDRRMERVEDRVGV